MLTNITLENFKAFKKLDNLKIKPITILCGTNSCGKSSILQSILLLKQTLENTNPNQNLVLNGRLTKLGYFEDIIHQKKEENSLKIEITGSFPSSYFYQARATLTTLKIRIEFLLDKSGKEYISKMSLDLYEVSTHKIEYANEVLFERKKDNIYNVSWKENSTQHEKEYKVNFKNVFLVEGHNVDGKLDEILFAIFYSTKVIFSKYSYIGPLRGEPEREYIYRDEVVEIGTKGENAAFLYLNERENVIQDQYFYQKNTDSFEKKNEISIKDALNQWFTMMKIDNFDAEIVKRIIYLSQNASKFDATKVGIADVGFGVSQILPILLEGLRMEKGASLLLEQPEIHLHPNLQMQMADYFISLALSNKNVMVETHSDHVVNRLVRRIVEDETHNLKDLIGIYFIKPSEDGAVYEEINIDPSKGITNWPPDFFDQTANEQMKIMQAGLKKRKNQRQTSKNQ